MSGKYLTREDVLRLIADNGGKSQGIDLSGRMFEHKINLSGLDLFGIILEGAFLTGANLEETKLILANLRKAHINVANLRKAGLEGANLQEVDFVGANLEGAIFLGADLRKASFTRANLQDVKLWGAELGEADFEGAHWGNYMLGEEKAGKFKTAVSIYRQLKQWHNNAGIYDIAGEFYFREMTAKRKALKWWPNPIPRAWSKFLAVLCGYGERPFRVVISAAVVVLGMAGIYSASALTFLDSLSFSAVSFTALGYGLWVFVPTGWVKALGAAEAFIGVFMMALFLITFVRKMTR